MRKIWLFVIVFNDSYEATDEVISIFIGRLQPITDTPSQYLMRIGQNGWQYKYTTRSGQGREDFSRKHRNYTTHLLWFWQYFIGKVVSSIFCRFLLCIIVEISLRSVTFVAVFASLCNAQNGLSCRSSASGFTSCSRRQEDQHLTANSSTCTQWSFWSDDLQLWMKPWQQGINSLSTKFSRFRYIGMHKSGRYSFIAFKLPKLGLPHILEMCRLKNAHFLVIICVIVLGTALTLVCHAVSSSTVVYSNLE